MQLSQRLSSVASMVTAGNCLADVGTDHGYVPIYLYERKQISRAIAMDVNKGPLERAALHIAESGMKQAIETRLSDGLTKLSAGEAEAMVCAGMGGPLMIKILEEGSVQARAMKELILQPQSEIAQFRKYLRTHGYHIIKEDMVLEDGKYYPMMKVIPGAVDAVSESNPKQQIFDRFGQYLLEHKHPVLKQYLEHSRDATETLMVKLKEQQGERALARLPELETMLEQICTALRYFED